MSVDRSNVPARKGRIRTRGIDTKVGLADNFRFAFRNVHRISPFRYVGDYWLEIKIANNFEKFKKGCVMVGASAFFAGFYLVGSF